MHEVLTEAFLPTRFIIHDASSLTRQSAMDKFDDATKVGCPLVAPPPAHVPPAGALPVHRAGAGPGPRPGVGPQNDQHVLGQVRPPNPPSHRYSQRQRRCVTGTPSTRFSRSEESCLSYCVDRFLDTSLKLVQLIQEQRNAAGGQ